MSNTWWKDADELIDEQSNLLDIDPEENLMIQGPPGCGKTNLLLLRANQLFLGDFPNLYVVVFGSLLKTFIQLGGTQYKFPADKVVTHTALFKMILQSEEADIADTDLSLMEARQKRADILEALITEGQIGIQFDALLLDEAQDYTPQEIRLLSKLSKILVATADGRQKIYEIEDCLGTLESCIGRKHILTYHFRNGLEICRLADGIYSGYPQYSQMQPHSNYNEKDYPSKTTTRSGLTLDQQIEAMADQIVAQQFAYPDDLIGILAPRNDELHIIEAGLIEAGLGEHLTRANASNRFDPSRKIWLSTLTAAKGLEFRALHIAGLDHLHKTGKLQKRLIFTGVTRAKTALTLYWHEGIPGYLQSACLPFATDRRVVDTKRLFGN